MTDPRFVRAARALREELEVDGVVIITWSKRSMPHAASAGDLPSHQELADEMANHLVSRSVPEFLLRRDWGNGPTAKSRKLAAGEEGAE